MADQRPLTPDEIVMLELVRKANVDAEITVIKRENKVVQVKVNHTHVKEFLALSTRIRENGVPETR